MNNTQEPPQICKPEINLQEYRSLLFSHMPALGRLLDNLESGVVPSPLEVMSAISESVDYFTDGETNLEGTATLEGIMPGQHCPCC